MYIYTHTPTHFQKFLYNHSNLKTDLKEHKNIQYRQRKEYHPRLDKDARTPMEVSNGNVQRKLQRKSPTKTSNDISSETLSCRPLRLPVLPVPQFVHDPLEVRIAAQPRDLVSRVRFKLPQRLPRVLQRSIFFEQRDAVSLNLQVLWSLPDDVCMARVKEAWMRVDTYVGTEMDGWMD